jgi:protein TonB
MHRMFADLVESGGGPARRGGFALPASMVLHAAAGAALVLVPLFTRGGFPVVEPAPVSIPDFVVVRPAGGDPGPRPPRGTPPVTRTALAVVSDARPEPDPEPPVDATLGPPSDTTPALPCLVGCGAGTGADSLPGDDGRGGKGGDGSGPATPATPVRTGGAISPPVKVRHVMPVYPEIARAARVQGDVVLDCVIGAEGRVTEVRILGGPVLLQTAAADAVKQWLYRPTLLNGVAVPVIMSVTVRFTLGPPG